MIYMIISYRNS